MRRDRENLLLLIKDYAVDDPSNYRFLCCFAAVCFESDSVFGAGGLTACLPAQTMKVQTSQKNRKFIGVPKIRSLINSTELEASATAAPAVKTVSIAAPNAPCLHTDGWTGETTLLSSFVSAVFGDCRSRSQDRQIIVSSWFSSVQYGHCFIVDRPLRKGIMFVPYMTSRIQKGYRANTLPKKNPQTGEVFYMGRICGPGIL